MSILDKVKALFADVAPATEDKIFVKTKDGKIFSVKAKELAVDAEILLVNEDATETPVEDGDYILEDESTITVKDGKVAVITPEVEDVTETEDEGGTEEVVATEAKMAVIKQVSKWAFDIDQDAIEVGTILTQTWMNEDGTMGTPLPISAGEYENEAGDKVQVDAEGKVVLITKVAPVIEVAPVEDTTAMEVIKAELEEVKMAKENAEKELKVAKEAFEKLKNQPATTPLDTRKFEKTEVVVSSKKTSMLDAVKNITTKK